MLLAPFAVVDPSRLAFFHLIIKERLNLAIDAFECLDRVILPLACRDDRSLIRALFCQSLQMRNTPHSLPDGGFVLSRQGSFSRVTKNVRHLRYDL